MSEFRIDLDAVRKSLNGHSIFAPSSSAMWLHCSGSLIANLLAADDAGEDAAYGTVGHSVGEEWLREGVKPTHRLGEIVKVQEGEQTFNIEIDHQMMDFVEAYVLWCAPLPGTHYVEQRVTFSQLTPLDDQGGTADHAACVPGHMVITDLKLGMGDKVYALRNTQALLYALGFFYMWDWKYHFLTIKIRIAQPRLYHFDEWDVTREELLEFAEYVKVRAVLAWQPDAPRSPSPKACRWCRIASSCTARLVQLLSLARGDLSMIDGTVSSDDMQQVKDQLASGEFALDSIDVKNLSTQDLAMLYPFIDTAKAWWEKLNSEIYKRAMGGQVIPTAKLVKGRGGKRRWSSRKVASRVLKHYGVKPEDMYDLRSPAQIEEVLRKIGYARAALPDLIGDLTEQEPAGLRLVPVYDKATEQVPGSMYDNAFDDLNE